MLGITGIKELDFWSLLHGLLDERKKNYRAMVEAGKEWEKNNSIASLEMAGASES